MDPRTMNVIEAFALEGMIVGGRSTSEVKAALLAVLDAPGARPEFYTVDLSKQIGVGATAPLDEEPWMVGPATRRKINLRWQERSERVSEYICSVTGYTIAELTSCETIIKCMGLVGPNAHPALYPALMKLWRLQSEIGR